MAQLAAIERAPELEPLQVATDNNFAPTPMEGLFSSVLPSLASALAGGTDDERVEALGQLAQVVDTSFGDDAVQVGGYLREHGVLKSLVWLLEHSDAVAIQQTTLLILGNLASDAVDASSTLTKVRLKELGAFEALLPHLFSDVWLTLVYALGAVQNMCTDVEYVEVMQDTGVVARLQELAATEDPQLEKYAKGCLSNMRETILAAAAARQWSVQASKVAATIIQTYARRRTARKRAGAAAAPRRQRSEAAAATRIAAAKRGKDGRQRVTAQRAVRGYQELAATRMAAAQRGKVARREVTAKRLSVTPASPPAPPPAPRRAALRRRRPRSKSPTSRCSRSSARAASAPCCWRRRSPPASCTR